MGNEITTVVENEETCDNENMATDLLKSDSSWTSSLTKELVGCFRAFWPLIILIPLWLALYPIATQRLAEFVQDAILTYCLVRIVLVFLQGVWFFRREVPIAGIFVTGLLSGIALLCCWNLLALYTTAGMLPITWINWKFTTRPIFYGLVLLLAGFLLILTIRFVKNVRPALKESSLNRKNPIQYDKLPTFPESY